MVNAFLIPVPFLIVMALALLSRNGKNRWLGYAGALAGIATLALLWYPSDSAFAWLDVAGVGVSLGTLTDLLSTVLASVVAGIGVFVFLYSVGYFEEGEDLRRYYALLALFAWSMLGTVIARNLIFLYACWELVGVSSFLLIGFWHEREGVVASARKAFLTILVGDVLLLGGILALYLEYGTFDIPAILASAHASGLTLLAGVGIIGGAISKSAQFPLHGWLADAMAGPTPVSAFLHSATMVKAGLYLIARFLPLLVLAGLAPWLLLIALLTILISAGSALVETDIKRVLAYSTMNQLAFILLALSLGALAAGMFHLVMHSIFKALLFFVAGIAIHAAGTQDITRMGLKRGNMLALATLAGAAALAGLFPFSGFASKEAIFDAVLHEGWMLAAVFSLAIVLSAAYIARWYLLIFRKGGKDAKTVWQMDLPLPLLAVGALVGGALIVPFFTAWGAETPVLLGPGAVLSTALVLAGVLLAWHRERLAWLTGSFLAMAARARFMMDEAYDAVARAVSRAAGWCMDAENRVINHAVRRLAASCAILGARLQRMQTGVVTVSVAAILIGFLLLVAGVLA